MVCGLPVGRTITTVDFVASRFLPLPSLPGAIAFLWGSIVTPGIVRAKIISVVVTDAPTEHWQYESAQGYC
ncbi:hypothetical protein DXT91_28110 [Agrobacterium tumefaciens]|nr:hypothetical protein [Agrobacterium tumefaciens]